MFLPDQAITCYADDNNLLVENRELSQITHSRTEFGDKIIQWFSEKKLA